MADKGIIFSDAMVRALLDGTKTQTRRLCAWPNNPNSPQLTYIVACDEPGWFGDEEGEVQFRVPHAQGDRLYVREAWSVRGTYTDVVEVGYRASESRSHTEFVEQWPVNDAIPGKGSWPQWPKYGPSIHMPRWASRIWTKVADVRVQRLKDISEADALAEGIVQLSPADKDGRRHFGVPNLAIDEPTASKAYRALWNSLHFETGTRWADNPWVTAYTLDVHKGNIGK